MKTNYWITVVMSIILSIFTGQGVTVNINSAKSGLDGVKRQLDSGMLNAEQMTILATALGIAIAMAGTLILFVKVADILLFNPLEVGCQKYFLNNTRGEGKLDDLKVAFESWGSKVGTMFLRDLFLGLWSLLFIIPGIVKAYSYRMVPYILADDPTITGTEAITRSRQMMNGHKWDTFVLDLSFLGWDLLSVFSFGLVGIFYLLPYKNCTDAELYRAIKDSV